MGQKTSESEGAKKYGRLSQSYPSLSFFFSSRDPSAQRWTLTLCLHFLVSLGDTIDTPAGQGPTPAANPAEPWQTGLASDGGVRASNVRYSRVINFSKLPGPHMLQGGPAYTVAYTYIQFLLP